MRYVAAIACLLSLFLMKSDATMAFESDQPLRCRVLVTSVVKWPGRQVTIRLRPECPTNSFAEIRFLSKLRNPIGDTVDGDLFIVPSEVYKKRLFSHWNVYWVDNSGRLWKVPERPL